VKNEDLAELEGQVRKLRDALERLRRLGKDVSTDEALVREVELLLATIRDEAKYFRS
jgi:hypothetical protein